MREKKIPLEDDWEGLKKMILFQCSLKGFTISNLKEIVEEVVATLEDNAVYKED
ncbi:hypothetical protein IA929_05025 [Listeria seeligeri]|uniref:hypothetical protein n=1 Tax=Listeria seeligeri TaxID=1640 RepID=UPI001887D5F6|nr:hypothetical protein [Listeria seeligeri]MBF2599362.1 hypothetical protein [Listeria seeligeri]